MAGDPEIPGRTFTFSWSLTWKLLQFVLSFVLVADGAEAVGVVFARFGQQHMDGADNVWPTTCSANET